MTKTIHYNSKTIFLILLSCWLLKSAFSWHLVSMGGDSVTYINVSRNIVLNHCISLSSPEKGECRPHWGGNQPPGYPLFLAVSTWILTPNSFIDVLADGDYLERTPAKYLEFLRVVVLLQNLILCLSLMRLFWVLQKTNLSGIVQILAAVILSFSPMYQGWSIILLTECLTLAVTVWAFAECLSLYLKHQEEAVRLLTRGSSNLLKARYRCEWTRYLLVFLGFQCALLMRYDSLLLSIPIFVTLLVVHSFKKACKIMACGVLCCALIVSLWFIRNLSVGLSIMPPTFITTDGSYSPQGFVLWGKTWMTHVKQQVKVNYPLHARNYSKIQIPEDIYSLDDSALEKVRAEKEKEWVSQQIKKLSQLDQAEFPSEIDDKFAQLAHERISLHPLRFYGLLPLQRLAYLISSPFYRDGLLIGHLDGLQAQFRQIFNQAEKLRAIWEFAWRWLKDKPIAMIMLALFSLWYYTVIISFGWIGLKTIHHKTWKTEWRGFLILIALSYYSTRLIFFSLPIAGTYEPRLLIESFPIMELAVIAGMFKQKEVMKEK